MSGCVGFPFRTPVSFLKKKKKILGSLSPTPIVCAIHPLQVNTELWSFPFLPPPPPPPPLLPNSKSGMEPCAHTFKCTPTSQMAFVEHCHILTIMPPPPLKSWFIQLPFLGQFCKVRSHPPPTQNNNNNWEVHTHLGFGGGKHCDFPSTILY